MNRRQRLAFWLRSSVDADWLASLPCRLIPGSDVPTVDQCGKTMPGAARREQR